jgi:hypothetical protein
MGTSEVRSFVLFIFAMKQFDWLITQKKETMEVPQIEGFILNHGVFPFWPA